MTRTKKPELKDVFKGNAPLSDEVLKRWRRTLRKKLRRQFAYVSHELTEVVPQPIVKRSRLILSILGVCFLAFIIAALYLTKDLPSPRRLTTKDNFAVSTKIFDRDGELLYEIFADENRTPITLTDLPPHVYQSAIAIEDKNFYKHWGFDLSGITRAIITNIKGERLEGGSTITQQLVKNALLTPERSIKRKLKEGVLAVMTEILYSKDEILEMYLNYISYGGTSVGIESAAQRYFDKSARELTVAEAALLAGLPQAPSRYSPFGSNPAAGKERQREVLRRMAEDGYISEEERTAAENEVLRFALSRQDIRAPHFVFYVRDLLYEQYGAETVEKGGLRVTTSLDLDLHEVAQASLSAEIDTLQRHRVSNGAALIIKPNTGEILSMIGSRDYFDATADGQVNVTLAQRQPGSSIKPIMYATALQEKVLNPGSILLDVPTCFEVVNQKDYCPKNYDGSFKGPITVRRSLGNSLNITAVKALKAIGLETFIEQANKMGITSWIDPSNYGLSLTLGGGEVRMIDLAQAFAVLANQGVKVPLAPILSIEDYRGEEVFTLDLDARTENLEYLTQYYDEIGRGDLERVMDRAPAYLTSHIMQDNNARTLAFGPRSDLVIPNQIVSAKTGTTNDLKDNWTVAFTPEFLTITWVGNNDGTPMNSRIVSGVTGASPIMNDIMSYILTDREPTWQEKPPDVKSAKVCAHGMPPDVEAQDPCSVRETELYWELSHPSESSIETQEFWVRPETGRPPAEGESTDGLVLQEKTIITDPVTDNYCSNCSIEVNQEDGTTTFRYEQHTVEESSE